MFGKRIELFKLFGFSVKVDLSWVVIALLITWSLGSSKGLFPHQYPDLSQGTYWIMGAAGMLGLFLSIILHELSHSLVARRFGMPIKGITLFIFGGVAEMEDEPPSAKAEFWMAIAGPIASVIIAVVCLGVAASGESLGLPLPVIAVLDWVGFINGVVVLFNLVPAFPLDGGRVLRAILWHFMSNIRKATKITASIGSGFGMFLIFMGILSLFSGNVIGGLWSALIGMFLRGAAAMSYQQLIIRRALEGETVRRFMNDSPITVSPDTTVSELVEDFIYKFHFKMFPVVEHGSLHGCVTFRDVKKIERSEWDHKTVRDIAEECSEANTVDIDADAMKVLSQLSRTGASRAMVTENGTLAGIISLKDLLSFLSMKIELEEGEDSSLPMTHQDANRLKESFPPKSDSPTTGSKT
jgi:Zn-dependent protease/CBS domain-containing protein